MGSPEISGQPLGPVGPISASGEVGGEETRYDPFNLSTLSRSEQEAIMMMYLASSPILPMPEVFSVKGDDVIRSVEAKFAEIGSKMWDNYIEQLHEQADRIQQELKSPAHQAWLQEHAANEIGKTQAKDPLDNRNGMVNAMNDFTNAYRDEADAVPVMAAALVISAAFVGGGVAIPDTVSTEMVAVNPIQDAASHFGQVAPLGMVDTAMMVINLFAVGAMYSAVAQVASDAAKGGDKPKDLEFARDFGRQVLAKVSRGDGNEIQFMLNALLTHQLAKGEVVNKERVNELTQLVKFAMLSIALALFYKVETGGLTEEEFANVLKENPYKEGSVESNLVKSLQTLLSSLPKEDSARMLEAILAYIGSKPKVEEMLDPEKSFRKILEEIPEEQRILQENA